MYIEVIGILAIILGTFRLVPQIVQGFKTKKVRDVSLVWELLGVISTAMWGLYGFLVVDWIVFGGALALFLSYLVLVYQKRVYE